VAVAAVLPLLLAIISLWPMDRPWLFNVLVVWCVCVSYFFLDLTYNLPQNVVDVAPQQRPLPND
jgi:hypothetical protein